VAVGLACAAVVAAAGCGEDQQFIDDYNEATKPLQELQNDLGGTQPDAGNASQELNRLAGDAKMVNDDLAALEAPDDAKPDFRRLKAALRKSERNLRDLARANEQDDIAQMTSATQALARDAQAIDRAENAVKRKVED
jgi:hypothetical protein